MSPKSIIGLGLVVMWVSFLLGWGFGADKNGDEPKYLFWPIILSFFGVLYAFTE